MPWYGYTMIGLHIFGAAASVLLIDKPREPITPAVALATLVTAALMIWGTVSLAN